MKYTILYLSVFACTIIAQDKSKNSMAPVTSSMAPVTSSMAPVTSSMVPNNTMPSITHSIPLSTKTSSVSSLLNNQSLVIGSVKTTTDVISDDSQSNVRLGKMTCGAALILGYLFYLISEEAYSESESE